jgi:hypothetical protein
MENTLCESISIAHLGQLMHRFWSFIEVDLNGNIIQKAKKGETKIDIHTILDH